MQRIQAVARRATLMCGLMLPLLAGARCFRSPEPPPGSQPTSLPAALTSGNHDRSMQHGGRTRTYILHVPTGYDGSRALPIVIMMHGGFGDSKSAARYYQWSEKADAEHFFAVFPNGVNRAWNAGYCCGQPERTNVDDIGFLAAMVDDIATIVSVDRRRIYATGMSNGGMMAHRLAAARPDLIAAIGPVAASIGGQFGPTSPVDVPPAPASPVAVMIFHGSEDKHVLYGGGETQAGFVKGRIDISAAESTRFWVTANGAAAFGVTETNAVGDVIKETHAAQGNYADVVLYTIVGQGHAWPGVIKPRLLADQGSMSINATDTLWEFFKSHPKP